MASFICLPTTTDTTMVVFDFHINHQNDPAPAVAITMYDLYETMYVLPKALSSRNNSPASLMATILLMMTFLYQYQCFLVPEEVNGVSCNSSHMNVPRTTHSSLCRNKSMDNAAVYKDAFCPDTTVPIIMTLLPIPMVSRSSSRVEMLPLTTMNAQCRCLHYKCIAPEMIYV